MRRQIRDENVQFETCAHAYSDCTSAKRGGDLGIVAVGSGSMQRAFEEAAASLLPGALSPLVQTDSGVHVIWRRSDT